MSLKSDTIIECNACHICDGELYEGWRVGCDDLVFRAGVEEAMKVKEEEMRKKSIEAFRQCCNHRVNECDNNCTTCGAYEAFVRYINT